MQAEPSPHDRPDEGAEQLAAPSGISLRPVLIVASLLILAAAAFSAYSCLGALGGGSTFGDRLDRYPPGSITYLAKAGSYLVRMNDGSLIALGEAEAADADRVAGCVIRYRPDLGAAGMQGLFRDDCHGALFDRAGVSVEGGTPPMQRHPVTIAGKSFSVQLKLCLQGGAANAAESCRV